MDSRRIRGIRSVSSFLALIVLICVMLIAPAAAGEGLPDRVYVNASYNDDTPDYGVLNFSSIQDAVDNVAEGGEVWVYSGTYLENLVIDKSVNATAVSEVPDLDYEKPIINALGEDIGVEITASDVSFSGFEVVNASAIGISVHGADAVTIGHNVISVLNDTCDETRGIYVLGGVGIAIFSNQVYAIGSSTQIGVTIEGVDKALVYDNEITAISQYMGLEAGLVVRSSPGIPAFALDEDESFLAEEGEGRMVESGGVVVIESNEVLVESNRVTSLGLCVPDESGSYHTAASVLGIGSGDSENIQILANEIDVFGVAVSASRTVGIQAAGDLALIQGNTVRSSTNSASVRAIGIRLDLAGKGQILENDVDVEATCTSMAGENGYMRGAGIVAIDSPKAQVFRNNVAYTIRADGLDKQIYAEVEGIGILGCEKSRMGANIVIVDGEIISLPTGDEPQEVDELPVMMLGRFTGIDVRVSDEPEIIENVVHTFGSVGAYDVKGAPDDLLQTIMMNTVIKGLEVRGDWDEPIANPVISDNVILVEAQTEGAAISGAFLTEAGGALADNSLLAARYAAVIQDRQEKPSFAACLADVAGLPAATVNALEFEPDIREAIFVQAHTTTAGIALENVLDPVVCYNHVPVYQNTFTVISNQPLLEEGDGLFASAVPPELISQTFSAEHLRQAAVLSLINENGSEWQNLSDADRAAITDAVLAGDAGALAAYTGDGGLFAAESDIGDAISRYQALLDDEDSFGFLNATRFAAAIPVSVSYGLCCYAEGDLEVYENNFTVLTKTFNVVTAEGENLDAPDAAAGSIGLVTAFGISGTSDGINIADNRITVENRGLYLTMASGGEVEAADAAAGMAHLLFGVGVIADAEDKQILNNIITVRQGTIGQTEAVNRVKDEMALSVAATACVGTGIILDPDEIFDPATYEPDLPTPYEGFADVVQGNTVSVTDKIETISVAMMLLPAPLDGSSNALSGAAGAAASFGIVAPEAAVLNNVIDIHAVQSSYAGAIVEEMPTVLAQADGIDLPGAGAINLGVAVSGGILTVRSHIEKNTVFTAADSETFVEASTEELLEDAGAFAGGAAVDIGIVSLSPSYIDGNTVDGEASITSIATASGGWVDADTFGLALDLGILSVGGDATFNNIQNAYVGLPYYYEDEEYEPYADYNWWGDASGPSGSGPGTGSPIIGTMNYEPWLTRPADVVLATGKSYFGLEIGSPNIGGDGYRSGLEPGWTTLSFPLALENNTWQAVTHAGDGLDYSVAWTWDAAGQKWVQMTATSKINPLDAVYIRMNDYDRLPVAISPEITSPPVKMLRAGWNLIGPAYNLVELDERIGGNSFWWGEPYGTSVRKTLTSIEETSTGLTGYVIVVSQPINPESWVYTRGDDNVPDMDATCGYWVYMKNPVELAGFSLTPLPMPWWAWDL